MADAPKILGTDTLRDAYPKLNSAIDNSNEAKTKADGADGKADTAIETANTAKTTAEDVQSQFDQVVAEAGENNPEVVQARGEAVNLNARLNATDTKLADIAINIKSLGAKGDGITDDTQVFKDAIFNLIEGQQILVPKGSYKITEPLIAKKYLKIKGDDIDNTTLLFQGTDGIVTTARTDYINISDLKIKDGLQGQGTIGVKLIDYSSYHRIGNISIEGFGQWGYYQEGGQTYELDTIYTLTNGKNPLSTNAEAGSFIITTPVDTSKVTTTGILKNLYARSGGKYGFRLNRSATIKIDVLIVEYHDIAFYADRASGATLTNYYEEANRDIGQVTWTHDANVTFINPRLSESIKRTYEGLAPIDRKETFIGRNDITTRFLEVDQVNLSGSTSRTTNKEGGFRYNNKNAEVYTGSAWESLQKVKSQSLTIPASTTVTYDLGLYDIDRIFELTVAASNQALSSTERYSYKRVLVVQGAINTGLLQTSILDDAGTLFTISFRENTGRLYLDIIGSAVSSTIGTISVKELAGTSSAIAKI
jgi:Pectate lyase superfamily protein